MAHTPEPWHADQANWCGEPDEHNWYISGNAYETSPEDDDDAKSFEPCIVATAVAIVIGNPTSGTTAKDTAARIVACINACRGLTPEQVAAIPRLLAWFRAPSDVGIVASDDEFELLEEIFPTLEAK